MKKFLSMVLALAMAMSLVTFAAPAAGAKDFTDNSSIQYKEAVDVISAIQIMDGYNDASFGPTGTLTRGAAAKIICNMILGPTTAAALPTNVAPFPDVPAGSTFAGYIAYCSEHNIISGYADGDFRPADSLSGYAFLKMLLCALGYDQEIEGYQGANWRVNVAKQALGIGLDDGLKGELDGSRVVTREEAALYAFNTLQADLVEYDNKTTVAVNGATVTVGGNSFHSKWSASQNTAFQNIDAGAMSAGLNDQIIQFAEEYFNRLERFPKKNMDFTGEGDSFGRPSTKWTWKGVEIGTYKVDPAHTYSGDVSVSDIYNDLKLSGTANDAIVYLNGEALFQLDIKRSNGDAIHEQNANTDLKRDNTLGTATNPFWIQTAGAAIPADMPVPNALQLYKDKVDKGTIVEVFHDDDTNKVIICAMSVYPGEIDSTHASSSTKDAYVVVSQKQQPNNAVARFANFNKHNEYETDEAFEEEEKVWFTYSNSEGEIGEVHRMTSVEGALTRRVDNKSLTLDGVVYEYGQEKAFDMTAKGANEDTGDNGMTNGSSYVIYRDGNGFVLWTEEADFAVDRYALIERISVEGSSEGVMYRYLDAGRPVANNAGTSWDSNRVRLLLSNGTERNFDLDESKRYRSTYTSTIDGSVNEMVNPDYDAGEIVRYVENSDGTVRLYTVGAGRAVYTYHDTANLTTNTGFGATTAAAATATSPAKNATVATTVDKFQITSHNMLNLKTAAGNDVKADSSTIFVIKEPESTKVYTGLRNAPDVTWNMTKQPVAYAYVGTGTSPTAKLIFVISTDTTLVENSSKDITFLTNPSDPFMSDTGDPYVEYLAVIKGVIQSEPVYVYTNRTLGGSKEIGAEDNANWSDGNAPSVIVGDDFRTGSIILNRTTYDNDGFLTAGSYVSKSIQSMAAQGIKKTSRTDEIKIDTHDDEITVTLASGANIYYVADDVISQINVSEIRNDEEDMVYYTVDDDGDVTNVFIVDYDDDDAYIVSVNGSTAATETSFTAMSTAAATPTVLDGLVTYWNDIAEDDAVEWDGKSNEDKLGDVVKALRVQENVRNVKVTETTAGTTLTIEAIDSTNHMATRYGTLSLTAAQLAMKNDTTFFKMANAG